ncbi:MAG: hypothetical protein M3P93_06480 [Actinomycetota bacterium]|nr:hypothetical protein [Actinomycetota bacterium]
METGARDYPDFLYDDDAFSERVTPRCLAALPAKGAEVDHFVPWSQLPNDWATSSSPTGGATTASATITRTCRCCAGGPNCRPTSAQVSDAAGWPLQLDRSRQIARGLYAQLPSGTPLWQQAGVFAVLDRGQLADVLRALKAS